MKHILIPTDFSAASRQAFEKTLPYVHLLGPSGAQVTLLSVLEDIVPASVQFEFGLTFIDSQGVLDEAEQRAKSKLEEYRKQYFSDSNIRTEVVRAVHPVHHEIALYAKEHGVDLIIMATHGRTGVRRLVLGSVTERVVRESSTPVLVIPASAAAPTLDEIPVEEPVLA